MVVILLVVILIGSLLFFKTKGKPLVFKTDLTVAQKEILANNVQYYKLLNTDDKLKFSKRVAAFLYQIKIKSISCSLSETDKILIGASAIIPVFGFDNWQYTNLKEVLVFPNAFNYKLEYRGYKNNRTILGMVGSGKLKDRMILSQKALRHGFENRSDKNNTAIHEFVHLIDMADGDIDGLPLNIIQKPYALPWFDLIHSKIQYIDKGKSDINPYGATSKLEFFAVISEYFFERPKLLKRKHPELYKNLSMFFNQDIA